MTDVEKYIDQFEPKIQQKLNELRQIFFDIYPNIEESIRYKIPAFKVGKTYLYFAAYEKHIGFYPIYGLESIENELAAYRAKNTKASLHFKIDAPLPLGLLEKIIILKSKLVMG